MDTEQKIFRSAVADQMRSDVKNGIGIEKYYLDEVEFEDSETWPLNSSVVGEIPVLSPDRENEAENAIALHTYLANLDETQASDKRLWTYLTHVTFRGYVQERWKLPHSLGEIEHDADMKKKVSDNILQHWFLNGTDSRTLKRHSLARLWWAANLTVAPWEGDADFEHLKSEDRYKYTRILLSNETLFTEVLERTLGNSKAVLISLLEYFSEHPEQVARLTLRSVMKELNLLSGIKRLPLLTYSENYRIVESIGQEYVVPAPATV